VDLGDLVVSGRPVAVALEQLDVVAGDDPVEVAATYSWISP
jgi:hypothetical protein